jgi:hypothetical protein
MAKTKCSRKQFLLGCLEQHGQFQITREHGTYCTRGWNKAGKHSSQCFRTLARARKKARS